MTMQSSRIILEGREEPQDNDALISHLSKMGLIKKVMLSGGTIHYQVTARGLQYIADREAVQREHIYVVYMPGHEPIQRESESSGYTIPHLNTSSVPFTPENETAFLRACTKSEFGSQLEYGDMTQVSLLIPTLREVENIGNLLKSLAENVPGLKEIIVVDGGEDETAELAAALGARVIVQQANGKGDALRQAFAGNFSGDVVVTIDADGSNRPEEIPRLVEAVENGASMAKGSRFLKGGGSTDISRIRRIGNYLFVHLVNLIWSGDYTDLCYGFVAFRRDALMKLAPLLESKNFEIETENFIKARKLGLKVVEVPSVELKRRHGTSNLRGVHDSVRIMKTVISELFST